MKNSWSPGLRVRLVLLGVALLLPMVALMAYQTWYYARTKIDEETNRIGYLAALLAREGQLRHLSQQKILATAASLTPAMMNPDDPQQCRNGLTQTIGGHEYMTSLALYAPGGRILCAAGAALPADVPERAFFRDALRLRSATSSNYAAQDIGTGTADAMGSMGARNAMGAIHFAQPILDAQGNIHAVLVAGLGLAWLDRAVEKLAMPPGTNVVVVDGHGVILMPKQWFGRSVADHPVFRRIAGSGSASTFEAEGIDGVWRIFSAQPLHAIPGGSSHLWIAAPKTRALHAAVLEFLNMALVASVAIFTILLWMWRAGNRWILLPIQQLRESARRIGKGEFSTRSHVTYGEDEIGQLARSFDEMAAAIESGERWTSLALDAAKLGVWDMDLVQDKVTRSLRHDQIFGYETLQPEWNAERFNHHILPEDRAHVERCFTESLATGRHSLITRIMRPDGEIRWINVEGRILRDAGNNPVRMIGVIADITERKRAEAELIRLNRTLKTLSECNQTLVRAVDEPDLLQSICRHIIDVGGYRMAWVGFALDDGKYGIRLAATAGTGAAYIEGLNMSWADNGPNAGPTVMAIREGRPMIVHDLQNDPSVAAWQGRIAEFGFGSSIALPLSSRGKVLGVICIYAAERNVFDTQEVKLLEELAADLAYGIVSLRETRARMHFEHQLNYQSSHDALTGLANRSLFLEHLRQSIERAAPGRQVAVAFVDLDRFKPINDSLSHGAGDLLLHQVSQRLVATLRHGDIVARLSADEFGIVMDNLSCVEDSIPLAQKLLENIAQPFQVNGQSIFITASIGICFFPRDGSDPEHLLQSADSAMNNAKSLGGNTICSYSEDINRRIAARLEMDAALRTALDRQHLEMHYQPKVSLTDGRVVGAEALIRWIDPERGAISPAEFIPLAEETGLIVPLGEWILSSVCRQIRTWKDAGLDVPAIAVNLSARQFRQENLPEKIRRALDDHGIEAGALSFEITESTTMADIEQAVVTLHELKAIGVTLSLDDFGTGYSSLSYLKRFPIDHLKIDQSFVRDVISDPDDAAICTAVIGLAHNLGMSVIAEGIETAEQMDFLRRHRCDEMQGHYFSRAIPAGEFGRLLTEGKTLALPDLGT